MSMYEQLAHKSLRSYSVPMLMWAILIDLAAIRKIIDIAMHNLLSGNLKLVLLLAARSSLTSRNSTQVFGWSIGKMHSYMYVKGKLCISSRLGSRPRDVRV